MLVINICVSARLPLVCNLSVTNTEWSVKTAVHAGRDMTREMVVHGSPREARIVCAAERRIVFWINKAVLAVCVLYLAQ